jgi:hypothetical protein
MVDNLKYSIENLSVNLQCNLISDKTIAKCEKE